MAFIRVEPVPVQVRTDWFSGRPARSPGAPNDSRSPALRSSVRRRPILSMTGPRTMFEVETPRARLALTIGTGPSAGR